MKAYLVFDNVEGIDKLLAAYMGSVGHEIEVPDKFTELKLVAGSLCDINAVVRIFPIPRPKKKVKKWRWWTELNGIKVETAQEKSEDEMVEANMQWHKISSTEIEVEE